MLQKLKSIMITLAIGATFVTASAAESEAEQNAAKQSTAEQREAETGAQQQTETGPSNSNKTIKKPATNSRGEDDVFNPSEEISEDYAVSFPVDI